MAVPKKKVSKARRNQRRAHDRLVPPSYRECSNCGELRPPHSLCPSCGQYRDKEVLAVLD